MQLIESTTSSKLKINNYMEKLQMGVAVLLFMCCIGMFYAAISKSTPMQGLSILFMGILLIGSFFLLRMSYKELKDEPGDNK